MKENKEHNNLSAVDRQSKAFFAGGKFNWEKSNAEVWASMEAVMKPQLKGRSLKFNFKASIYAVAASLLILVGIGSFLRFQRRGKYCTEKNADCSRFCCKYSFYFQQDFSKINVKL